MNKKVRGSEMNYKKRLKYKTIIKVINSNIDKKKASVIIGCSFRKINQSILIKMKVKVVLLINLRIKFLLIS